MKNKLFFSLVLCGLPIIPTIYFFSDLPDQMVIHINSEGIPDAYANKYLATFGVILFCMVIQFVHYKLRIQGKNELDSMATLISLLVMPVITNLTLLSILHYSLKGQKLIFDPTKIVGILLLILGLLIFTFKWNFMFQNQWRKIEQPLSDSLIKITSVLYSLSGLILIFLHPSGLLQILVLIILIVAPRFFLLLLN